MQSVKYTAPSHPPIFVSPTRRPQGAIAKQLPADTILYVLRDGELAPRDRMRRLVIAIAAHRMSSMTRAACAAVAARAAARDRRGIQAAMEPTVPLAPIGRATTRTGRQMRDEATTRPLNLNSGVASGQPRAQALDVSCSALAVLLERSPC